MSEVIVREAGELASEVLLKIENARLGRENQRLNEGLEALRMSNEVLTRELEEAERQKKAARQKAMRLYDAHIAAQAEANEQGPARRWGRLGIFLLGMVAGMAVCFAITWLKL